MKAPLDRATVWIQSIQGGASRIDRASGAQHHHGHTVAPGVEQTIMPSGARHCCQHAAHGLAGRLGIAVRDRDRVVLMQAQQDAGIFIAR